MLGDVSLAEAMVEGQDGERDAAVGGDAQRLLPRIRRRHLRHAVVAEQPAQPLARAVRITGKDDPPLSLAQFVNVAFDRLVDVRLRGAFGGEVARRGCLAVDRPPRAVGDAERRGQVRAASRQQSGPFVAPEVERSRFERTVAALLRRQRGLAVVVILLDRLESRVGGLVGPGLADDDSTVAEIVEQRRQPRLEQRQPVLHPRQPAAIGHRLVQRVAGRGRAERVEIPFAERLDARVVEQDLVDRQQGEALRRLDGALGGGVEAADGLDLVAEEVEAERVGVARGEQVEQPAAHSVFARLEHRVGADISVGAEHRRELVAVDPASRLDLGGQLADPRRGEGALEDGVDGGDEELRLRRGGGQRGERRQPVARHPHRRRGAVVRQAVPRREIDGVDLGREVRHRVEHAARRRIVGGDEHRAAFGGPGDIGHQPRLVSRDAAGEGERFAGGGERAEVDQRMLRAM
jgi:hypothetical protein